MRVAVVGGGPAGLYFSALWKSRHRDDEVRLFEQNAADATWGFGVVFSDRALEFLREDDPDTVEADLAAHGDLARHRHRASRRAGRHRRRRLLGDRPAASCCSCCSSGRARPASRCSSDRPCESVDELAGYDLIVAADGVNSLVRRTFEADFGFSCPISHNKFAWYGTTKPFDTLTQTFVANELGTFNAHHYRYAPDMSTFIVECDPATWSRAGFDKADEAESRSALRAGVRRHARGPSARLQPLDLAQLPVGLERALVVSQHVLIGDALHTAHYSIGSGTRLAHGGRAGARQGAGGGARRRAGGARALRGRPAADRREAGRGIEDVGRLVRAVRRAHAACAARSRHELHHAARAASTTTGCGRCRRRFMALYDARWQPSSGDADMSDARRSRDAVPRDAPGTREIGFSVPDRYNASAILFDNLVAGRGDRRAVTGPAGARTYAELAADAARFGAGLLSLGLQRGDRVLLFLDDTPAYPAALFGAIRAGLVPVLINTLTPPDLLQFYLADSGGDGCDLRRGLRRSLQCRGLPGHAARDRDRRQRRCRRARSGAPRDAAAEWLARPPVELAPADTHRDDMAFWMYSSGSTGRPEGHRASAARHGLHARCPTRAICCSSRRRRLLLGAEDLLRLRARQLAHLSVLRRRLERAAAGPAQARRHLRRHRALPADRVLRPADALHRAHQGAGGQGRRSVEPAPRASRRPKSFRPKCSTPGRRCRASRSWRGWAPPRCCTSICPTRPRRRSSGAAGKRVPGYEIELRDSDGREVADGEEGILWVRGDSNAPCYWNRPDKTAETMREGGWIYTGDRFVRDADGFHFFRGRADDLVKVSRPVGLSAGGRALPRRPSVGARVRGAGGRSRPTELTTLKAFVVLNDRRAASDADHARAAGLRQGPAAALQIPAPRRPISTSCRRPAPARSTARPCSRRARSEAENSPPPGGGRLERHGLSSPPPSVELHADKRAKSDGVPGGGEACRQTPPP